MDDITIATAHGWKPNDEGTRLLDDLAAFVRRYVIVTQAQANVLALWIVHTWAIDAAETTPYLHITSAEPSSGKTRVLEVLALLCRAILRTANISEAALYRVIEERPRTLLFDEVDAIFGPKARDREDLRGLLNAGYRRGNPAVRIVGEGGKMRAQEFEVFAPKALTGLGDIPPTLADRSLSIRLKKRAPGEHIERLREKRPPADAATLRNRCERFAEEHGDALADAEPDLPDELDDRAQDVVEPLLAIADIAGGDWPEWGRRACIEIRRGDDSSPEPSLGVRALADCRVAFDRDDADRLASADLIARLAEDEDSPWADWHGEAIKPRTLATILRPYEIRPRSVRLADGSTPKGYLREQFVDAWTRYLPASSEGRLSATTATADETTARESGDVAHVADKPSSGEGDDEDEFARPQLKFPDLAGEEAA